MSWTSSFQQKKITWKKKKSLFSLLFSGIFPYFGRKNEVEKKPFFSPFFWAGLELVLPGFGVNLGIFGSKPSRSILASFPACGMQQNCSKNGIFFPKKKKISHFGKGFSPLLPLEIFFFFCGVEKIPNPRLWSS